jgi:hypothetical protein
MVTRALKGFAAPKSCLSCVPPRCRKTLSCLFLAAPAEIEHLAVGLDLGDAVAATGTVLTSFEVYRHERAVLFVRFPILL